MPDPNRNTPNHSEPSHHRFDRLDRACDTLESAWASDAAPDLRGFFVAHSWLPASDDQSRRLVLLAGALLAGPPR